MAERVEWPFVRTVVIEDVIDSTSDRARTLVSEGAAELPLLVWARSQLRGRGRGARQWWSDRGSLTFTVVIDPAQHHLSMIHEPRLALATTVAIIDALADLGLTSPAIGIRWPNDVEAHGRKLGGILPERVTVDQGHRLLVGVGLNVSSELAGAPHGIRALATSLAEVCEVALSEDVLPELLSAILKRMESVLVRLAGGDVALASEWDRLDQLRDRWVAVDLGTSIVAGWGRGIDAEGALCLDVEERRLRLFGGQVIRAGQGGSTTNQPGGAAR
jgi:BirA family transcriptional regulator, biotin operon repressor / biotin---[acetyl-CoA-carboxylase] ligase